MSWLGNFFTGNNSSSTSTSSTTTVTGGTYAGVGQTTPSTLPYTIPTTHTVGTVGVATGGGGWNTYVSPSMGVYNPNQTTTISTGYSTYPNVGTIHIAGTNPTISTDKGKLELNALIELVDTLKERLLILTPNFEKMEKYAALKKAYDHYKLMESMIGDEDVNKSNIVNYTLDTSGAVNIASNVGDVFYDTAQNTMYYTTSTGTVSTITMNPNTTSTIIDRNAWDTYGDWFKRLKEFEDTMPELTKIKEMCSMYPAMDRAFENFKAVYDLIKDDYEARKNNDS